MFSPAQLHVVNPPNLLLLLLFTNTSELGVLSHLLWKTSALSESTVALYNKFNVIFLWSLHIL